jgi:hypothetical protein
MRFWLDLDDFINDVARYIYYNELADLSRKYITMNRAYNNQPTDKQISEL